LVNNCPELVVLEKLLIQFYLSIFGIALSINLI
jgi:hypothetical protein